MTTISLIIENNISLADIRWNFIGPLVCTDTENVTEHLRALKIYFKQTACAQVYSIRNSR